MRHYKSVDWKKSPTNKPTTQPWFPPLNYLTSKTYYHPNFQSSDLLYFMCTVEIIVITGIKVRWFFCRSSRKMKDSWVGKTFHSFFHIIYRMLNLGVQWWSATYTFSRGEYYWFRTWALQKGNFLNYCFFLIDRSLINYWRVVAR